MNTEVYKQGITLIESLFVLGIMAILIGMVMVSYSMAASSMKTQQLTAEALQLIQITQQLSDSQTTFMGMSSGVLVKTGLVPSRYVSGGSLVTPWGGEIEAIPYNYGQDNGPDIYLAFNFLGLPREACEKLGVMDFSGTAQSLTVTGMQDDDPSGLSPIKVITNCQNGNNNYVNIRIEH